MHIMYLFPIIIFLSPLFKYKCHCTNSYLFCNWNANKAESIWVQNSVQLKQLYVMDLTIDVEHKYR